VYSTPTLDLTNIDPGSLNLSGASVAKNAAGKWQVSYADVNDDGRVDIIAHFLTTELLVKQDDTHAVLEGQTQDNRLFRGMDSIRVIE
jgi:hypothetical protein